MKEVLEYRKAERPTQAGFSGRFQPQKFESSSAGEDNDAGYRSEMRGYAVHGNTVAAARTTGSARCFTNYPEFFAWTPGGDDPPDPPQSSLVHPRGRQWQEQERPEPFTTTKSEGHHGRGGRKYEYTLNTHPTCVRSSYISSRRSEEGSERPHLPGAPLHFPIWARGNPSLNQSAPSRPNGLEAQRRTRTKPRQAPSDEGFCNGDLSGLCNSEKPADYAGNALSVMSVDEEEVMPSTSHDVSVPRSRNDPHLACNRWVDPR